MSLTRLGRTLIPLSVLTFALAQAPNAAADHIRGVITNQNSDGTFTVSTDEATTLTVVVGDATKMKRVDGMREVHVSSVMLIPGLRVHVSGDYDGITKFVADKVTFNREDQKMALAIKGGVIPTDQRSLENQAKIAANLKTIEGQQRTLALQANEIAENNTKIGQNSANLAATNARITKLNEYNAVATVVVHFANGKYALDANAKAQLDALASRAKGMTDYLVQVQGYASAVGPDKLNQTLSKQRADAVAHELQQEGVPPVNVVFPAAMGIEDQVASNKTTEGQAENRRTVITLLQSKAAR